MSRSRHRSIPDWPAIQRAEDAGETLSHVWRAYAARAALPYDVTTFRKEFRKWQASAPADSADEWAASDVYWSGKAAPRPDVVVLDDGATVRMRGGFLEIFNLGKTTRFDAGPHHMRPHAIVFAGWGGSLTVQAARFCVDHKIGVIATGWLGDLMTFVAGPPRAEAALIRAQCAADPLPIGRAIVLQKLKHYGACGRLTGIEIADASKALDQASSVAEVLGVEAKWSSISWRRWCGDHTLALAPRTGRVLPPWLAMPFVQRASGLGATGPRHATDPINAMLNIAYAKEAGRLGARLAAAGACLAIGFLHCDKLNRHSLVFDALEALRPLIDARILKFVREHRFDRGDFFRLKGGYVRMHSGLIQVLLEKSALPEADLSQACEFMLNLIQNRPKRARRKARI